MHLACQITDYPTKMPARLTHYTYVPEQCPVLEVGGGELYSNAGESAIRLAAGVTFGKCPQSPEGSIMSYRGDGGPRWRAGQGP